MKYYTRHVLRERTAILCAFDLGALAVAAAFAAVAARAALGLSSSAGLLLFVAGLIATGLAVTGAYRPTRMAEPGRAALAILLAVGAVLFALGSGAVAELVPDRQMVAVLTVGALATPTLLASRWSFRRYLSLRPPRRLLLLGDGDLAQRIAASVFECAPLGFRVVGYLDEGPDLPSTRRLAGGASRLGTVEQLEKVLRETAVDHVLVACAGPPPGDALLAARASGIAVEPGSGFYERLCGRVHLRSLEPYELAVQSQLGRRRSDAIKRLVDVAGAAAILALCGPVLLAAAVAIRLESPGSVLYSQVRLGRGGRSFRIYKLRSMHADAERETGAVFATRGDRRITRVGRFLRKTRIDEVPQLWNVLRGDMSLVGPRPERPEFAEELGELYRYFWLRTLVRPGLSGWAQTRGGYVDTMDGWEEKLELDLYYVKNHSLDMDLLIALQTAKTVLSMGGQ